MARKLSPQLLAHLEWIGFVRPTGLVVSATALENAGVILNQRDAEGQNLLRACVAEQLFPGGRGPAPYLPDFAVFARQVLGWSFSPRAYAGTAEVPIPPELEVPFGEHGELLRPDFAVREREVKEGASPWQLLVQVLPVGEELDKSSSRAGSFELTPHGRLERLLRKTGVSAGVLFNGRTLRLLSAPHGETSGWADFQVADMLLTAGRSIASALRLLLSETRLLALPRGQRLPALLEESRKYQNTVSERLAEQVLHALYELLRGFQAAHDASRGELLRGPLEEQADQVYRALLTVILRLVFLLYAEERDLLPGDETFRRYYRLGGLYERLREDAAQYPDTRDQRFGAWAQLLVLFRLVHDGAQHERLKLPRRHGELFDPDRFPFLEGRAGLRQAHQRIEPPLVPDGTIYRALEKLLVLDGERLSYRALDVEQIGSVYETMMGFRLETATGLSIAIKAAKKQGAPTTVDLEALLAEPAENRDKWLRERADRKVPDGVRKNLKASQTLEDLYAALLPVVDGAATPDLVPRGAMVLQPSEERRKSGSHYTPRSLTEPIVKTTLEPILARLRGEDGRPPRPEQILDLKVCDPAMGSGAFLVEACRQLGAALVESWRSYGEMPAIPPDEDELVFARRLVAQRCLYGVDRNPMAVDLAKVSLWLATLARDHALTFVDHALRHGDSLVGLSRKQIEAFHWDEKAPRFQAGIEVTRVREHTERILELRQQIREAGENVADWELRDLWDLAQVELSQVRLFGDLVLAAFFEGSSNKEREATREEYAGLVVAGKAESFRAMLEDWRRAEKPLVPFHWEVEFPEVFNRENSGFDAFAGNPPFAGKNSIAAANVATYLDWLKQTHEESHGNADLVAHFFRRVFSLLREAGTLGLIATNTIGQGDTRSTGLRWICLHGGDIFAARSRVRWPGQAAVMASVIHIAKCQFQGLRLLDGLPTPVITAFLFHRGGHEDPVRLFANIGKSFVGSVVLGMGFTFDDNNSRSDATSLAEMKRIIEKNPRSQEVVFPYIGGEEVNTIPRHSHHRYVINFGDRTEAECRQNWPDLMDIVEMKVKPGRMKINREFRKKYWWRFGELAPALNKSIANLSRALVVARTTKQLGFAFLSPATVFSENTVVFPLESFSAFSNLQARIHEIWVRFTSSTLKDDIGYRPSDCFETFPFPNCWQNDPALEEKGKEYYEFRAALMVRNNEGMTKTYNRFHDPNETSPDIEKLRELHTAMDRAVLEAYGWSDIPTDCDFFPDFTETDDDGNEVPKSIRYRWPDEVRDEVLARLLELNAQRAEEERQAALADKAEAEALDAQDPQRTKRKPGKPKELAPLPLFDDDEPNGAP